MIKFYRPLNCPHCGEIEAKLKEMVMAYQTVVVDAGQRVPDLPATISLPAFVENKRIVSGEADIVAYLKELEAFMRRWQRFQSDSCYSDEDDFC